MNIKITLFALMAGFSLNVLSGDRSSGSSVSMTASSPTEVDITTTFVYLQISDIAKMAKRELNKATFDFFEKVARNDPTITSISDNDLRTLYVASRYYDNLRNSE